MQSPASVPGHSGRISVAMATYNGERYLPEMLDSLAGQTRLPDELVVRDDGSSDSTLAGRAATSLLVRASPCACCPAATGSGMPRTS